jgi:LTXXQ motif family protein
MSRRIVAGLAAGLGLTVATLTLAMAAPHFGGGGGAHFGGGGGAHFGGGGAPHFGGGGAPHFGGGGAPHFGGGGAPHFGGGGAPHFGGGGGHIGGGAPHFGGFAGHGGGMHGGHGGGVHVGHVGGPHGGAIHAGGVHAGGAGHLTGHTGHAGAAAQGLAHHGGPGAGDHGLAHVGNGGAHTGNLAHAAVGHQTALTHQQANWLGHQFGQHNFDRHFGERDRFFAQHGFRRGFFGWAGPVFWLYAYNDLFDYMFWPYDYYDDYYDPFWAYGYDDLFAGIFYPGDEGAYGYGGNGYGYGYAETGSTGRRHHRVAARDETNNNEVLNSPAGAAALCDQEATSTVAFPFDQIQQTLQLSDEQKAKLDELKNAAEQAMAALKASCPTGLAITPVARLEIVEGRLAAMLDAMKTVNGPMNAFYASLSDDQKLRFNQISLPADRVIGKRPNQSQNGVATICGQQATGVVQFPIDAFDKAVHPDEAQRAELKDLSDAATRAAEMIKASCPAEPPLSVPARLEAMQKRLEAMLESVKLVRGPLEKFYSSLNDEQKARLNQIAHQQQNAS